MFLLTIEMHLTLATALFARDDLRSTSIDNPFQKVPITLNTERKLVWKRPNFCTYVMTYFKAAKECEVGQKSLHMRNFDNYLSYSSSYFQLKFPGDVFLNKGKVGPSSTTTKPSTSLSTKDNYGHLNLIWAWPRDNHSLAGWVSL